jgi:thymidine kinase
MSLTIIIGPMYSGKSSELIHRINLSQNSKLVINHISDTRYDKNNIVSHNGLKYSCISLENLEDLFTNYHNLFIHNLDNIEDIFIDEAQFFKDIYNVVWSLVVNMNKNVFISGLDGDFQIQPFKSRMLELIPLATEIIKLKSQCYICKKSASFSKRLSNQKEQILIGKQNIYQPACLLHIKDTL